MKEWCQLLTPWEGGIDLLSALLKRIKWAGLAIVWIVMRLFLIPLDIILFLGDMTDRINYWFFISYGNLYNRYMALFGYITIEIRMLEEGLDDDKEYINLAERDKKRMLLIMKQGK